MSADKPKAPTIKVAENGPYIVNGISTLRNSRGELQETKRTMALCRCGGSASKPFCDGTHAKNGFSGDCARTSAGAYDAYAGESLEILDNRAICSHAGYCTDGLPDVFRMDSEPWIDPDGADAERIMEIVHTCPSGALRYRRGGEPGAEPERELGVRVSRNGPYQITGGPPLEGQAPAAAPPVRDRFALCRCGASKNKPFCDGSHWDAGFADPDN
jgi:CDGSH-type Zn-finger protein